MTVFVVLLLPLLVVLGFWQLDRADQKRGFEDAYLDRIGALPRAPGEAVEDFQRLKLVGRYEPGHYFLLDNQVRGGAVGYEVVSSFRAQDGRRWLVNRGFLAAPARRDQLPAVTSPAGPVVVVGVVWPELGLLPTYGDDAWPDGWPKRVQRLEVERMSRLLENAVPRQIRLEAGQPGVFEPPLLTLNMPSEKHIGYAVQWFGLAAALLIGYLIYGFKANERRDEP